MRRPHLILALYCLLVSCCAGRRTLADVDNRSSADERCLSTLQPVLQKVAFMFLVSADMHHEAMWTKWFSAVSGQLPAGVLCKPEALECLQALPPRSGHDAYTSQHLFSIYVHTKPDFAGFPEGSLFHSRVIGTLLPTAWGDYSLAAATRLLIAEALQDPLNQRFQLLCQTTIPLQPPLVVYTQLLAQNRSRVNWFPAREAPFHQWVWRFPLPMYEDFPGIEGHTRFHRQFVTLTRRHAQLIQDDSTINPLFERHCFMSREQRGPFCISDEQYIGSALSYFLTTQGEVLDEQLMGTVAVAMAISGDGFSESDATLELLEVLRAGTENTTFLEYMVNHYGECFAHDRLNFTLGHAETSREVCADYESRGSRDEPTLPFENCHFFARKFSSRTPEVLQPLLERLNIIPS